MEYFTEMVNAELSGSRFPVSSMYLFILCYTLRKFGLPVEML